MYVYLAKESLIIQNGWLPRLSKKLDSFVYCFCFLFLFCFFCFVFFMIWHCLYIEENKSIFNRKRDECGPGECCYTIPPSMNCVFFFVCFVLLSFNIDGQQNKKVAHLSQTSKSVVFLLFFVVVGLVWTSLAIDGYPLLLLYTYTYLNI